MADKNENKSWFARHKVLTVIMAVIAVFIIAGIAGGGSGTNTNNQAASSSNKAEDTKAQPAANEPKQPEVPAEYKSALSQAGSYANTMHMSKKGVYDQLVSEYGGKFSTAAAQYAIDNVKADWNANALAKAKDYQNTMKLSPAAIRDQLVSAHGEKFTAAEADYAIQHLNN